MFFARAIEILMIWMRVCVCVANHFLVHKQKKKHSQCLVVDVVIVDDDNGNCSLAPHTHTHTKTTTINDDDCTSLSDVDPFFSFSS